MRFGRFPVRGSRPASNNTEALGRDGVPAFVGVRRRLEGVERLAFDLAAAFDLADDNIRCNSIAPGAVPVPNDPCPTSNYPPTDGPDEKTDMTDAWMMYTPLARWGDPVDIGRAAVFLASDDSVRRAKS